jgi:hypothetical protein
MDKEIRKFLQLHVVPTLAWRRDQAITRRAELAQEHGFLDLVKSGGRGPSHHETPNLMPQRAEEEYWEAMGIMCASRTTLNELKRVWGITILPEIE